jgi:hypothetical protein
LFDDSDELRKIHRYFVGATKKLPDTMNGLPKLFEDAFTRMLALGMDNRVASPSTWAGTQVFGWVTDFFRLLEPDEQEVSCLEKPFNEMVALRTLLVLQASRELELIRPASKEFDSGATRIPILIRLEEAGKTLRNPEVRNLIRTGLHPLVEQVFQARIDVLAKSMDPERVLRMFPELTPLKPAEVEVLFGEMGSSERGIITSRKIAVELIRGRCGLDASTVLKYAQPGRPKDENKKRN